MFYSPQLYNDELVSTQCYVQFCCCIICTTGDLNKEEIIHWISKCSIWIMLHLMMVIFTNNVFPMTCYFSSSNNFPPTILSLYCTFRHFIILLKHPVRCQSPCTTTIRVLLYRYHNLIWLFYSVSGHYLSGHYDFHANITLRQYGVVHRDIFCNDHSLFVMITLLWLNFRGFIIVDIKYTQ